MIRQLHLLILALAFATFPSDAALFPKKSSVQQIDSQRFRETLKEHMTFVAAFVAPWCGHCQKLAPELIRAADGLHPLVPVYAIDCDDNKNKPICAEQGVQGFPTLKLFPRGGKAPPVVFDGTRSASSIFYWASRAVPSTIFRTQTAKGISEFVAQNSGKPKVMLLNKSNKIPLLWKVLSNKYSNQIAFGNCRNRKGKISVELGYETGEKSKPQVLVYGSDDSVPVLYEGVSKFAALSKFFDEVIEGTVDISRASLDAKQEALNVPESKRKDLDDETRIGDAGYGGFNPHEGLDMNELLKHGMNPHGHGHPGAPHSHAAAHSNSDMSTALSLTSTKGQSPPTETQLADAESQSAEVESQSRDAEIRSADTVAPTAAEHVGSSGEHVESSGEHMGSSGEHAKDEL